MIVTDDQLLIDMELLFNAIREAKGDWEKVENDMRAYLKAVQSDSYPKHAAKSTNFPAPPKHCPYKHAVALRIEFLINPAIFLMPTRQLFL